MDVRKLIKVVYIVLLMFSILGLIALIPFDKYKNTYDKYRLRYKNAPQMHVDATERYVEAIEEGREDTSKGILGRAPKKYYLPWISHENNNKKHAKLSTKKYDKPLYVRDKSNPRLLKPFKSKYFLFNK